MSDCAGILVLAEKIKECRWVSHSEWLSQLSFIILPTWKYSHPILSSHLTKKTFFLSRCTRYKKLWLYLFLQQLLSCQKVMFVWSQFFLKSWAVATVTTTSVQKLIIDCYIHKASLFLCPPLHLPFLPTVISGRYSTSRRSILCCRWTQKIFKAIWWFFGSQKTPNYLLMDTCKVHVLQQSPCYHYWLEIVQRNCEQ